jgi:hypothetical protein
MDYNLPMVNKDWLARILSTNRHLRKTAQFLVSNIRIWQKEHRKHSKASGSSMFGLDLSMYVKNNDAFSKNSLG